MNQEKRNIEKVFIILIVIGILIEYITMQKRMTKDNINIKHVVDDHTLACINKMNT